MEKTKENKKLYIGILLMLVSSTCTCVGQLLWKIAPQTSENPLYLYLGGAVLYGIGACSMIIAFKFGEMSILHPMLSFGFILSLFLGAGFLEEPVTWKSIVGVILILAGMIFLGSSAEENES